MHHPARPGFRDRSARALWVPVLLLAALTAGACGSSTPSAPSTTPPTAVDVRRHLTVNGAVTNCCQTGTVSSCGTELADAVIGVGIGAASAAGSNDNATSGARHRQRHGDRQLLRRVYDAGS